VIAKVMIVVVTIQTDESDRISEAALLALFLCQMIGELNRSVGRAIGLAQTLDQEV
jgi:hypothetical protein